MLCWLYFYDACAKTANYQLTAGNYDTIIRFFDNGFLQKSGRFDCDQFPSTKHQAAPQLLMHIQPSLLCMTPTMTEC